MKKNNTVIQYKKQTATKVITKELINGMSITQQKRLARRKKQQEIINSPLNKNWYGSNWDAISIFV